MLHYYPITQSFHRANGSIGIAAEVRALLPNGSSRYVCSADDYQAADRLADRMNDQERKSCRPERFTQEMFSLDAVCSNCE